jgi:hypothetical protein
MQHARRYEKLIKILVGKLKERDHSEDLGIDGRIILQRSLEKLSRSCGLDSSGSG